MSQRQPRLPIWENAHVRTEHTDTELAAAETVKPKVRKQAAAVLAYLDSVPGATDEQGTTATGLFSYRRRRADLKNLGLVVDSGLRQTNRRGQLMIVWRAAKRLDS